MVDNCLGIRDCTHPDYVLGSEPLTLGEASSPNPIFVPALAQAQPLASSLNAWLLLPIFFGCFASPILRYRVSGQHERRQIKWLALSGEIVGLFMIVNWGYGIITNGPMLTMASHIVEMTFLVFIGLFPSLTIGIAILRHNLYDIDIIIRRTLVYSVLTAILAIIYFGGVVVAQAALRPLIGENSDAGIVISTLVIAALFTPLRRRIQNIIDRRFYRRKYNAERTLAAFNATMRDEVDLDKLQAALVNVVQETMQPKSVGLWVNQPAAKVSKEQIS